jgi:ABC-type Mn2+/Zn2+ transport system permease subunit
MRWRRCYERSRVSTVLEVLTPGFILRDALVASVLVGLVCPLVGVYFVLRRMIFLGVALPQLSAAGIAFALLMHRTVIGPHPHGGASDAMMARLGATMFTLGGILLLALLERRGREFVEARIGMTYAIAGALTILFLAADPWGEAHIVNLLKGELLAATETSVAFLAAVLGAVVITLLAFQKEFLLVSFDHDLAVVFGKRTTLWDALLYLLCGVTISFGVLAAGPLVTFGFLLAPPLAARELTRRMLTFSIASSAIGGVTAFVGFCVAFRYDMPLGPAEVAVSAAVLLLVIAGCRLRRAWAPQPA